MLFEKRTLCHILGNGIGHSIFYLDSKKLTIIYKTHEWEYVFLDTRECRNACLSEYCISNNTEYPVIIKYVIKP